MKEETIQEIETILNNIFEKAQKQLKIFKQEKNLPVGNDLATTLVEPDLFLYSALNIFWNFYHLILLDIRNPLIQFSMRPLLEFCYSQIIYFASVNKDKRRDLAIKTWLCNFALTMQDTSEKDNLYCNLTKELKKKDDRIYFERIQNQNFPQKEISDILKRRIHLPMRDPEVLKQIETYLPEFGNKKFTKENLSLDYQWLCQYQHANRFLLNNLEEEQNTKNHVTRCTILLFLTGYSLLDFVNKKILSSKIDINDIKKSISQIWPKIVSAE